MTCITCKHYKAKACYRFSLLQRNPVTGLQEIKGVTSAEKQRKPSGILATIQGKCGTQGRFWCPTD